MTGPGVAGLGRGGSGARRGQSRAEQFRSGPPGGLHPRASTRGLGLVLSWGVQLESRSGQSPADTRPETTGRVQPRCEGRPRRLGLGS